MSATPFFLNGSGYPPGELFNWVVSDFSLIEAIECGIVKIPRVPVADATTKDGNKLPIYRNIFHHVRENLPVKGRRRQGEIDPEYLPSQLAGALESLYEDYEKTAKAWETADIETPPVFIVVCNNTSTSDLVYKWIGGYKKNERWVRGQLDRFSNVGKNGVLYAYPRTFLIDSEQLESGEALTKEFKEIASGEIDQFKREMRVRNPEKDINKIADEDILREVMNTVGKAGKLGAEIRCVVSVSMLTEGWDANTVTHICGVRAFGTQLLCEQVVGRALRRLHYDTDENGMLSVEYANVYGVPFVFAKPGVTTPKPPKKKTWVRHLDERAGLAIRFPHVRGYKIKPSEERITAKFSENSRMKLTPEDAPPKIEIAGIIGEDGIMSLDRLKKCRMQHVVFRLAAMTAKRYYADDDGYVAPSRFRDLVPIVRRWLDEYLDCLGGTFAQYLLWRTLMGKAAEKIRLACDIERGEQKIYWPILDSFTPEGFTNNVNFPTSNNQLYESTKSHVNIASCDSDWEIRFCQILEDDKNVVSYVRNAGLDFAVPYTIDGRHERRYFPDFIVRINDYGNLHDLLSLVVEIKGLREEDAVVKADTMNRRWVPSVNNQGRWGRWAFLEITDMRYASELLAKYTTQAKAA